MRTILEAALDRIEALESINRALEARNKYLSDQIADLKEPTEQEFIKAVRSRYVENQKQNDNGKD